MSLAGLVNYSDDDSSSSSDEQTEVHEILKKNVEKKPVVKPTIVNKETKTTAPINTAIAAAIPNIIKTPTVHGEAIEYNKRLIAALAPKPIEGVVNWGIPDEPTTPCDPERAGRIAHFLSLRASGHRLNDHLQHNKAFRNPRIYARLVEFTEVEEFGSNFAKEEFNPYGFPAEFYINGILETQKKLAEEKVASQQNRTSVNFVPTQQPELSQQQSSAMAQAMATAAKVASRIAKPPIQTEKRRNTGDHDDRESKRR